MSLFADRGVLIYCMVALRLLLFLIFIPEQVRVDDASSTDVPGIERGLTTLGDYAEHFTISEGIRADNLPYRDYWVEFPPVWPLLTASVSALTDEFTTWAGLIFILMTATDVGNVLLLRQLGTNLHDAETGIALSWVYAILAAPLVMTAWNFEVLVLFTMLGALWWLRQPTRSGLMMALGILTKYIPLLVLPTVWKYRPRTEAIRTTLIALGVAGIVLVGLVVWGGQMAFTALTVQFDKPSYQTVWALIDGNYTTGSFPGGDARYDAEASAVAQTGNPAVIPGWLRLIPFALLGLWLFRREMPPLAFLTLTLVLFMLWSQGWSPQWLVTLSPFILLNFPTRIGVLLVLTLTMGAFLEYPVLFRYAEQNVISGQFRLPYALLIVARTVILASIAAMLIGQTQHDRA